MELRYDLLEILIVRWAKVQNTISIYFRSNSVTTVFFFLKEIYLQYKIVSISRTTQTHQNLSGCRET